MQIFQRALQRRGSGLQQEKHWDVDLDNLSFLPNRLPDDGVFFLGFVRMLDSFVLLLPAVRGVSG